VSQIAIVEDDDEVGELMKTILESNGYEVVVYPTPGRFFDALLNAKPDLAFVDMRLPGMDGREIIRVLRANVETKSMLLIGMSAEDKSPKDAVNGFNAGADEYFVKPIDGELLLVRVDALLRRKKDAGAAAEPETVRFGDLTILPEQREVRLDNEPVTLTRLEFDLLLYFIRQRNRVLTRSALLEMVWQGDPTMSTRTVDKHVETLRRKLGSFGERIETVIRVGYILR
jgi:two-component system alkaline phosphatase synthesis response regulator PhoP